MSKTRFSVKHLNPRQGITNTFVARGLPARTSPRVKHLNPRQGITTVPRRMEHIARQGVKHLNPRQGITTTPSGTPTGDWPARTRV